VRYRLSGSLVNYSLCRHSRPLAGVTITSTPGTQTVAPSRPEGRESGGVPPQAGRVRGETGCVEGVL